MRNNINKVTHTNNLDGTACNIILMFKYDYFVKKVHNYYRSHKFGDSKLNDCYN
jgi:hypothetical protein